MQQRSRSPECFRTSHSPEVVQPASSSLTFTHYRCPFPRVPHNQLIQPHSCSPDFPTSRCYAVLVLPGYLPADHNIPAPPLASHVSYITEPVISDRSTDVRKASNAGKPALHTAFPNQCDTNGQMQFSAMPLLHFATSTLSKLPDLSYLRYILHSPCTDCACLMHPT